MMIIIFVLTIPIDKNVIKYYYIMNIIEIKNNL